MSRLLLLSNSQAPGEDYLGHARDAIAEFLGPTPRRLAFIPYASVTASYASYAERVGEALRPLGHTLDSVHHSIREDDPTTILRRTDAVVVGGGNTFRLIERVTAVGLLEEIRKLVREGMPYIGWSAGANLACPTIRTTNDMPIIEPPSFAALGLVPFQINPHYTDATLPDHGGESRADRIQEFVTLNPAVRVVGLREGSWLKEEGRLLSLHGPHPMKLFESGRAARDIAPGSDLRFLLQFPGG